MEKKEDNSNKQTQKAHVYLETHGNYRMRELDNSDLEQFNALLTYAFQVTSYELLQPAGSRTNSNPPNGPCWKRLMSWDGFTRTGWHP